MGLCGLPHQQIDSGAFRPITFHFVPDVFHSMLPTCSSSWTDVAAAAFLRSPSITLRLWALHLSDSPFPSMFTVHGNTNTNSHHRGDKSPKQQQSPPATCSHSNRTQQTGGLGLLFFDSCMQPLFGLRCFMLLFVKGKLDVQLLFLKQMSVQAEPPVLTFEMR